LKTLKQLYLGSEELFTGLEIGEKWNWEKFKYPVIYLDFSYGFPENFSKRLILDLIQVGEEYGMKFENVDRASLDDVFRHLVNALRILNESEGRHPSFVILIDEYDKAILDCLDNQELVRENLHILSVFLQMVKSQAPAFSLVTGSSRIAHSSVFSGDNNRTDISFDPKFNELCGFTEEEIKRNLDSFLGEISLEVLKEWFDGYFFGGNIGVFNPYSIANTLVFQKVCCYWVRSGTTKLLAKFCGTPSMKEFVSDLLCCDGLNADLNTLLEPEDVSELGYSVKSLSYLFLQSGYLTLTSDSNNFKLKIPNKEIRYYAFPRLIISGLTCQSISQSHPRFSKFSQAIRSRDVNSIYDSLFELLQVIGYPDRGKIDRYEDYYQTILQAFFLAVYPSVRVEERTSLGKSDVFADFGTWKILFELKVLHGEKDLRKGDSRLEKIVYDAFQQAEGQYLSLAPNVICIFVFNSSTRTLFARENLMDLSTSFFKQYS
jgi:hypothetical protein